MHGLDPDPPTEDEVVQIRQRVAELEQLVERQGRELTEAHQRARELRQSLEQRLDQRQEQLAEVGRTRAAQELQQAQRFEQSLSECNARLVSAASLADVLDVLHVLRPARSMLAIAETDAAGVPTGFVVELVVIDGKSITPQFPRLQVRELPGADRLLADPERVLFIDDVASDPALTERERELTLQRGVRSIAAMPLRVAERWVGVICLAWSEVQRFREEDRRLFQGLLSPLSLAVDNRNLLRRTRAALEQNLQQRAFLQAIFDRMPLGILVIDAKTHQPLLQNEAGRNITGRPIEPGRSFFEQAQETRFYLPGTDEMVRIEDMPLRTALRTGQRVQGDFDIERPDQPRTPIEATAIPIPDLDGRTTAALLLVSDLTERTDGGTPATAG